MIGYLLNFHELIFAENCSICVVEYTTLLSVFICDEQGIDLKAGGRNKKTKRTAPKSENVYLKLLVKVQFYLLFLLGDMLLPVLDCMIQSSELLIGVQF